jgi:multidrug efflux pump subunit AcrA (membrane-fusion protein)
MEGYLDELDRPRVATGGTVTVTLDALPGAPLSGEVAFISPVARVAAGVVSYAFNVRLRQPYPAGTAEGMSATAAFGPAK